MSSFFSVGFCYAGGDGYAGYRQENVVHSKKEAEDHIKAKLSGQKVEFKHARDKVRAYIGAEGGTRTGYIYFEVKTEYWVAIDTSLEGDSDHRAIVARGTLGFVKDKVKKYIEEDAEVELRFIRTKDNIKVCVLKDGRYEIDTHLVLYRVM